jgi:hypothetical protein
MHYRTIVWLLNWFIEWNIVSAAPIVIRSQYLGQLADVLMHKIPYHYRFPKQNPLKEI